MKKLCLLVLPTLFGCSSQVDNTDTSATGGGLSVSVGGAPEMVAGGASLGIAGGAGAGDSPSNSQGGTVTAAGTSSISTSGGIAATAGTSSTADTGGSSAVARTFPHNDFATCSANVSPPSDTDALFVSATSGVDDDIHGTALAPLKSVTRALEAVRQSRQSTDYTSKHKYIIVEEGVYSATLAVPAYIEFTVVGGWIFDGTTWKRDCADGYRSRTVIGGDDAVGVSTPNLDRVQNAGFYAVTIKTKPEGATVTGKAGESVIGVTVNGHTQVWLNDVDVIVGRAGNGGAVAQPAPAGNVNCDGRTCPGGKTPDPGVTGASAAKSGADGSPGTAGKDGPNGTPGMPGGEGFCASSCSGQCTSTSSTCASAGVSMAGAGNGLCGCGGLGGAAGAGGKGGGSALGIQQSGLFSEVAFNNVSITVGGGGDGSPGGRGGAGGPGTTGRAGNSTGNCPSCKPSTTLGSSDCACQLTASSFAGGAAGGPGAPGSSGGDGGAGAGGDAWAVFVDVGSANAYWLDTTSVSASVGSAGTGAPGAVNGNSGKLGVR